jgi:hypothetical protein
MENEYLCPLTIAERYHFKNLGIDVETLYDEFKKKENMLKNNKMKGLPNFVMMVSKCGATTALRLRNPNEYYRDGGDWGVGIMEIGGKLYSHSGMTQLNGLELLPTTEEKWRKCNGQYAPSSFTRYGIDTFDFSSNPCAEIDYPEPKEEKNKYEYLLIQI